MKTKQSEYQKNNSYTMKEYMNNPNIKEGACFELKSTPRERLRGEYGLDERDNTYCIVKKYSHCVLCKNIKTGFEESFNFWELSTKVKWI